MQAARPILVAIYSALVVASAHAAELYSPGLPASPEQSLACRIVNVSASAQVRIVAALPAE
jgi:hypothetical protein